MKEQEQLIESIRMNNYYNENYQINDKTILSVVITKEKGRIDNAELSYHTTNEITKEDLKVTLMTNAMVSDVRYYLKQIFGLELHY